MGNFIKYLVFCAFIIMLWGTSAAATPLTFKPEEAFKQAFPHIPVESIVPSDINGLYEVISGTNIYYYHQEKDYLFSGNFFQKNGINITGEKRAKSAVEMTKNLPLNKAVKMGKANGKIKSYHSFS